MRTIAIPIFIFAIELAAAIAVPIGFGYFKPFSTLPLWIKMFAGGVAIVEFVIIAALFAGIFAFVNRHITSLFVKIAVADAAVGGAVATEFIAQLCGMAAMQRSQNAPNYVTFAIGGAAVLAGYFTAFSCAGACVIFINNISTPRIMKW